MMTKNLAVSPLKRIFWILSFASLFVRQRGDGPAVRSYFLVAASSDTDSKSYRTVQVQVVHRHGDRSPITPLMDIEFWNNEILSEALVNEISQGTTIYREVEFVHLAKGKGPFGKLSKLGFDQMVDVGRKLYQGLVGNDTEKLFMTPLFKEETPLNRQQVQIRSTDFERTIQSVQGTLQGLFEWADESLDPKDPISIDVSHTITMIPDPRPRRTEEQETLEAVVTQRPRMLEQEELLKPLAIRATKALSPLLDASARDVQFGVVQKATSDSADEPLSWNQLAEITKCLEVRDMLPEGLTEEDQKAIAKHTAWRWFETLSNPRLIYLAMNMLITEQVQRMQDFKNHPPLTIWSAHDSTLIGLLCAYRLEQPAVWPEYASILVMEVLQNTEDEKDLAVRFSINGERLRSQWIQGEYEDIIALNDLAFFAGTVGAKHDMEKEPYL